jgi:hypothetical protein
MKAIRATQRMAAALATMLLSASVASAAVGDLVPDQIYAVPGVVHTTYLATVFQCTNANPAGFGSTTMTVEVFDHTGLLAGSGGVTLSGGATGVITTGNVASLQPHAQMGVVGPLQGSARIIGKKLLCAAYVMSPGSVPGYMNSLPVVKKVTQKGQ